MNQEPLPKHIMDQIENEANKEWNEFQEWLEEFKNKLSPMTLNVLEELNLSVLIDIHRAVIEETKTPSFVYRSIVIEEDIMNRIERELTSARAQHKGWPKNYPRAFLHVSEEYGEACVALNEYHSVYEVENDDNWLDEDEEEDETEKEKKLRHQFQTELYHIIVTCIRMLEGK